MKLPLSSLFEEAIKIAKSQVPSPQPWEAIRHVTQNQLLKAQVVRDENSKPLPDQWSSGRHVVAVLAENWRYHAVGEILLALFESDNVTGKDVANICRSIWGSTGGEAEEEFHRVMEHLSEEVRLVEEDKGGVFRVKRPKSQESGPSPLATRMDRTQPVKEIAFEPDELKEVIQ
jgi:hypothetical protein